MFERPSRWTSPFWFLLLNVIGWVAFYFAISRALVKQDETPSAAATAAETAALARATDARLAALEAHMQNITARLDALANQPRTDDVSRRLSQAELRRLESTTARLEDELGSLSRRTHVTVDLNTLVQSLRPNVSVGLLRVDATKPGAVELTFHMRNLGPYAANVDASEIVLAAKPLPQSGPIEGELLPGRDYTFQARRAEPLLPNEPRNLAYSVLLNDPRKLEQPLYYRLTFRMSTDPAVVATSSGLLKGKLPEKEIQGLSVSRYSHAGEMTSGAQRR